MNVLIKQIQNHKIKQLIFNLLLDFLTFLTLGKSQAVPNLTKKLFRLWFFKEPNTEAIARSKKENPKVIINVGGMKHEVIYYFYARFIFNQKYSSSVTKWHKIYSLFYFLVLIFIRGREKRERTVHFMTLYNWPGVHLNNDYFYIFSLFEPRFSIR